MKYGIIGGFIRFAFAKTAFDYIEKVIPEINIPSYKKRVRKEYKAIVARTPSIGQCHQLNLIGAPPQTL